MQTPAGHCRRQVKHSHLQSQSVLHVLRAKTVSPAGHMQ